MEFDPSEQHFKLDQNRSELLQAEQKLPRRRRMRKSPPRKIRWPC